MIDNPITLIKLSANQHPALVPTQSMIELPSVTLEDIPGANQFSAFLSVLRVVSASLP
ncbi:hypothetical protein [Grimontia indica]|uniref:hypothetical protein n=1 Tax=Grimontia indica TaxID=1056512 RepID=UPI001EF9DC6E|nr:hypothetical protein [Grimontia indica]